MSAPRNSLAKLVDRLGPSISPEHKQLVDKLQEWDVNNDGSYSAEEVFAAVQEFAAVKKEVRNLKKLMVLGAVAGLVICGVLLGLSVAGSELSKDTRPDADGLLLTTGGEPVAVATATAGVPIWDLPKQNDAFLSDMENFAFMHGDLDYVVKVAGYARSRSSEDAVEIYFTPNPVAVKAFINATSVDVLITWSDGTTDALEHGTVDDSEDGRRLATRPTRDAYGPDYLAGHTYRARSDAYLKAANKLKLATGPFTGARNAYFAATATDPLPQKQKSLFGTR